MFEEAECLKLVRERADHVRLARQRLLGLSSELLVGQGEADIERRARWLARRLEHAGRFAGEMWQAQRERLDERKLIHGWTNDVIARTHLVTGSFERNVGKLGKAEATRRTLRHWGRRLLAKDRVGIRLPVRRRPTWGEVVGDALIEALEDELGRSLRNPRRKEALGEIEVLVEAFALITRITTPPALTRGKGIRRPGSARWFASRIATLAAKAAAQDV
jgi:hypothetical protein